MHLIRYRVQEVGESICCEANNRGKKTFDLFYRGQHLFHMFYDEVNKTYLPKPTAGAKHAKNRNKTVANDCVLIPSTMSDLYCGKRFPKSRFTPSRNGSNDDDDDEDDVESVVSVATSSMFFVITVVGDSGAKRFGFCIDAAIGDTNALVVIFGVEQKHTMHSRNMVVVMLFVIMMSFLLCLLLYPNILRHSSRRPNNHMYNLY